MGRDEEDDCFYHTQLIEAYNKYGTTILGGVMTENPEDALKYGFAKGSTMPDGAIKIEELIEKPGIEKKPSNLAIVSGQVYSPDIFEALEEAGQSVEPGKELVYIDGVNKLREKGGEAYAVEIKGGKYYDCGSVTQYLKTNIEMALRRPKIGEEMLAFIKEIAKNQ